MTARTRALAVLTLILAVVMAGAGTTARSSPPGPAAPSAGIHAMVMRHHHGHTVLGYRHVVVIYQENHSFDNLFGTWGRVGGRRVDGLARAKPGHTVQLAQDGT